MKIGIMGGTFDPVHVGHLIMADRVKEEAGLDQIWFMPSGVPPHKTNIKVTDPAHRLQMLHLAVDNNSSFRIHTYEVDKEGISYTIDTVLYLLDRYPQHQFHWIIGADMIAYLPNWHRIEELLGMIAFIGLKRPGYENALSELPKTIRDQVHLIDAPQIDISSTELRHRIARNQSIQYVIPESVEQYIQQHQLYKEQQ